MSERCPKFLYQDAMPSFDLPLGVLRTLMVVVNHADGEGEDSRVTPALVESESRGKVKATYAKKSLQRLMRDGYIVQTFKGGRRGTVNLASVYALGDVAQLLAQGDTLEVPLGTGGGDDSEGNSCSQGDTLEVPLEIPKGTISASQGDILEVPPVDPTSLNPIRTSRNPADHGDTIPDDWHVNGSHVSACVMNNYRCAPLADHFRQWATDHERRRTDWDKTFGAFLNVLFKGRAEVEGFRELMEYLPADWESLYRLSGREQSDDSESHAGDVIEHDDTEPDWPEMTTRECACDCPVVNADNRCMTCGGFNQAVMVADSIPERLNVDPGPVASECACGASMDESQAKKVGQCLPCAFPEYLNSDPTPECGDYVAWATDGYAVPDGELF